MSLEQWDNATAEAPDNLTVEQMDELIRRLRELKETKEAHEETLKEVSAQYEAQRKLILDALKTLKRDNYSLDGAGLVYINRKEVYTVPKANEDKTKLFNYIKDKYGPDALMSMVGIHSATLNSWANKETDTGEVMEIPGLDQPTMIETINFRKKD